MEKKKLWGGRFGETSSEITERISTSVHFDARLYRQDIRGSLAHARMLQRMGILSPEELTAIQNGLKEILREIDEGVFEFSAGLEDVHMNIESALTDRIGDAGRKLHTARSRNDQVALDLRLYIRDEGSEISLLLQKLAALLTDRAGLHVDVIMPGYTHLQVAQPVRFSQHLLAHAWALLRDRERLEHALAAAGAMPLGVGACAGVNYENDREFLRAELGFNTVTPNSMDTVSDRDFVLDFLYFSAVLGMHLSRFSEELVLWTSSAFGFVRLSDTVTTGSSIMPQKRNPDVAELIRGKSGRLYGNLIALMTVMKGLPLTYNRDLQEDKEPLFDSIDTIKLCLEGMIEMISTMEVREEVMLKAVSTNFSTATDLADYLTGKGVPFRKSHEIVGSIVKHCESENVDFFSITLEKLRKFSDVFDEDALVAINPASSTDRKASAGSTSKKEVLLQIKALRDILSGER